MNKRSSLLLILFSAYSCSIGPKPISYGIESCHFCSMTIVDKQHAAQYINSKGKAYNFDAAECMINFRKQINDPETGLFLVADFTQPEKLIEAKNAVFIVSEEIPSPMGANLTSVASQKAAAELLKGKTGDIYDWNEIIKHFKKL